VHRLRGWFWPLWSKPLELGWVIATTAAVAGLAALAFAWRQRPQWALGCVFLLGATTQFGLALAEGRGLDALRERAVITGHGEFARTAADGASARPRVQ